MKFPHKTFLLAVGVFMALILSMPRQVLAGDLPDDSYYQFSAQLENQDGAKETLADFSGSPVIVSMIYASCQSVCPTIVSSIQQLNNKLPEADQKKLKFLMISFDPAHDSPAKLREMADRHHVDLKRWTFARTTDNDTRALAAILDIKYKALPNGMFNHTTAIILLDAQGNELASSAKLGNPEPEFLAKVKSALEASSD